MKILTRYLALAAVAVILGSCSFAVGALNHKKSRVVASAIWHGRSTPTATHSARSVTAARTMSPLVAKRRVLPARPASAVARSSRSVGSRDISASTDIDYITYTIVNLDPGSGESAIQDYLDPFYPYIDVFLTPGQNYRITLDVVLLPGSPAATAGANVGLGSSYGDAAEIAVPADGSDVWVDLFVHPSGGIVIKNLVTGGNTMHFVDLVTGSGTKPINASVTTADPHDKFFYTSDLLLYYFNYTNNTVYRWPDIGVNTTSLAFDGTQAPGTFRIYAVCPDPAYAGWFYVVGEDTLAWAVYWVNYDPAGIVGPTTAAWTLTNDITNDLDLVSTTVSVTGVAADPYGFAYVTFYNTQGSGSPMSGMVEFDTYSGGSAIASYIPDTTGGWTSANSIFTDVMYGGSNLYLLASPNTSLPGGVGANTGTADVFIFDIFFNQLSSNPSAVARSFNGTAALGIGSSLSLPNRFAGIIQSGMLFVSETDFVVGGLENLSGVSTDLSSVRSVP